MKNRIDTSTVDNRRNELMENRQKHPTPTPTKYIVYLYTITCSNPLQMRIDIDVIIDSVYSTLNERCTCTHSEEL